MAKKPGPKKPPSYDRAEITVRLIRGKGRGTTHKYTLKGTAGKPIVLEVTSETEAREHRGVRRIMPTGRVRLSITGQRVEDQPKANGKAKD